MSKRTAFKKKAKRSTLRNGAMAEMFAEMDRVYEGALEVIRRHPVAGVKDDAQPRAAYKKAPRLAAAPSPEIVAYAKGSPLGKTGLIRAVALAFPQATVAEIRASLPDLNPSTVGIQVGKARR